MAEASGEASGGSGGGSAEPETKLVRAKGGGASRQGEGAGPEGKEAFVHWISNLLIENSSERRRFWRYGSHQYIHVFTLEILHKVLKLQEVLGIGFQAFIDVLQRVAEEQKMMDLCDEEQDDWVPLNVVREFMSSTYLGAVKLMADISNPIDRE